MATLKVIHKRYIVERLACFDTPSDVVDAVRETFDGLDVTRSQVLNYDASKSWARKRMARDLVKLFDETRAEFRRSTEGVPMAIKSFRLRRLLRLADRAESMGNVTAAAQMYEQAAKEVGGVYTNARTLDLTTAGNPISADADVLRNLPPDELAALYAERIRRGAPLQGGGAEA